MKKTLIIYNNIPEKTQFFVVETASKPEKAAWLCSGVVVNVHELTEAQEKASNYLFEWMASQEGKAAEIKKTFFKGPFYSVVLFRFAS